MIRTAYFKCELSPHIADMLNAESGRIYTEVMVEHYRIYRHSKKRVWLSSKAGEKLHDFYNKGKSSILHSHSIDAAQQGFYKACKTAKSSQKAGITKAKYPHKRKYYRTTVWKSTGIKLVNGKLRLALAEGIEPLWVELPEPLQKLPQSAFAEVRLKFNKVAKLYEWHIVYDDCLKADFGSGFIAAGDMGEIHPITLTDSEETVVIACRQLRAENQRTNKVLADIQKHLARCTRGSRMWKRLQRRKRQFLEKQKYRKRDIQHKISRKVVDWCKERRVRVLAIGDVRDIADGKRLNKKSQQKISNWSHGKLRRFINYKADAAGIAVIDNVNEAYTSQTCVACTHRYKPQGRVYTCPRCGAVVHRDAQGAANILSLVVYGELAKVPVTAPKYRYPVKREMRSSGGHPASSRNRANTAVRENRPKLRKRGFKTHWKKRRSQEAAPL